MSTSFAPTSPIERLVHAGDYAGTLAFLRPLTEAERRRHGSEAGRMLELMREHRWKDHKSPGLRWDAPPTPEQEHAAVAAVALCGTPKAIAESWIDGEHLIALAREFSLSYLAQVADAMLQRGAPMIRIVQRLIGEGLIVRPDSDQYALGLVCLPEYLPSGMTLQQCFEADPGLQRALLRMFDIEGNADTSLASAEKYRKGRNGWTRDLLELCRNGVFTREELLDKALSALEHDWPQYRSGWFSRFHEELAPTPAEMGPRRERYLHLLGSRIPPTVTLALEGATALADAGRLDAPATVAALRPVLAKGNKQQVEAALKLLERCATEDASLQEEAAAVACAGLVNDSPPLQKKLLQFAGKHAASPHVVAALTRHGEGIAASNRALYDSFLGGRISHSVPTKVAIETTDFPPADSDPLAESRRLPQAETLEDLIELVAFAFENGADSESFERAATALVARHPLSADEMSRFGPLLKRATKVKALLPSELARLLLFLSRNEHVSPIPDPEGYDPPNRALRLVRQRTDALSAFAARAKHLTPLATPTHRRGFIAPSALIDRVRAHHAAGVGSTDFEQELALLRLGPATEADREQARTLSDSSLVRALQSALDGSSRASPGYSWRLTCHAGDGVAYYSLHVDAPKKVGDHAITAARHPALKSKAPSYHRRLLCGQDAGVIGYFGSLVPSDMEPLFAEGARAIGNNLDWWEACWQDKAYLEPLLDSTVPLGDMAMLVLACALLAKEPGQAALAVDCLVQAFRDGRLDTRRLADVHARLALGGMARLARLRKSFDAARRIEPRIEGLVVDVIEHLIQAIQDEVPRDFAKLLELLNEICVDTSRAPSHESQDALEAMKLGGAAVALRKSLLLRS